MKLIKLSIIILLFVPLLTNCGVNKKKKATTPVTPEPVNQFCIDNPTDPSCQHVVTPNGQQKVMTGFFQVTNQAQYEKMLKGIFGFCDATYITYTGEIFSTILGSAISSAANRCSKWNDRGALKLTYLPDGRVSLQAFAISNYGPYIQDQYQQLFYIPAAEFIPANENQDHFINLDHYARGARTGLILYSEENVYDNQYEIIFELDGIEMARIRMHNDNTF